MPESPAVELDNPANPEAAERARAVQQAEDAAAAQANGDAVVEGDGDDGATGAAGDGVQGNTAEPGGAGNDGGTPATETAAEVTGPESGDGGKAAAADDTSAEEGAGKTTETEPAKPAKRRRAPKLDPLLAADVDAARNAVLEVAPAEQVGEHSTVRAEDDRVVTHFFESKLPGYAGWQWFAVLARVPRGKVPTVSEVGLLPSDRSLLAPEWVPWAKRIRPEEKEQADADQAEADANSKQESEPEQK